MDQPRGISPPDLAIKPIQLSFIRPHLEYCAAVWDPYLTKDIATTRIDPETWAKRLLLSKANVPSLAKRHSQARLVFQSTSSAFKHCLGLYVLF